MKKVTRKWYEYAKADIEAAEVLVKAGETHYSYRLAVLHCHQAIEKILKTVIVEKGKEPRRTHDLVNISQDSGLKLSLGFQSYINKLNAHYQPSRYPDIVYHGPVLKYTLDVAKYHLTKTRWLFKWLEKQLSQKK